MRISVGINSIYENFYEVTKDKVKRQNFAINIPIKSWWTNNNNVKFINYIGYDFIGIDWRFPIKEEEQDYSETIIILLK